MRRALAAGLIVLGMVVAGCGGGEAPVAPSGDSAVPGNEAPSGASPDLTSQDPGGLPGEQPSSGASALPETSGHDVSGLGASDAAFATPEELAPSEESSDCFDLSSCANESSVDKSTDTDTTTEPSKSFTRTYTRAKVVVNGQIFTLRTNSVFPRSSQVFRVTEIAGDGIDIELVAGEFTNGAKGTHLDVNERIKLFNQHEGEDYIVKLKSVY
jgi:hypothetical protein